MSLGVKLAVGGVVALIVIIIIIVAAVLIWKAIKKRQDSQLPAIASGALSVAAGAATPADTCSNQGQLLESAFVRYSLIGTSKNQKTVRVDGQALQVPIKHLTRVITVDVSKLSNVDTLAIVRTVMVSNNFTDGSGGDTINQSSNISSNVVYIDSQLWKICAEAAGTSS